MPSEPASPDDLINENDVERLNTLGLNYLKEGAFSLAVKAFQKATHLEPLDGRLWYNLGVTYDTMGDLAAAKEVFQGLTMRKPDFALAWSYAGWVALQQAEYEEAIRAFIIANTLDPELIEHLFGKLKNALKNKNVQKSTSTSKWIIGASLGSLKVLDRILITFQAEALPSIDATSLAKLGTELKSIAQAIQKANTTKVRIEVGIWLSKEYDIDTGVENVKAALTRDARNVEGWLQLGGLALQNKLIDEAEHAFRQSLSLDPENVSAQAGLGAALMEKNMLDEAEKLLRNAVTRDPTNWQAWARLAKILLHKAGTQKDAKKTELLKEAKVSIETAIKTGPENAQLRVRLADIAEAQGDDEGMKAALRDAARIDPFDASVLTRLSMLDENATEP